MYGCMRTFHKFSTFKTHIYERHGSDPKVTNQPINASNGPDTGNITLSLQSCVMNLKSAIGMEMDQELEEEPAQMEVSAMHTEPADISDSTQSMPLQF